MRYLGGKSRIARKLVELMNIPADATYVEPFCGGCNVIAEVKCARRIANDVHPYLIALLSGLQAGWTPPDSLSIGQWRSLRDAPESYDPRIVGFAGFCCSYGARWFEGYGRTRRGDDESGLAASAARSLTKFAPKLEGIEFHTGSYAELDIPEGAVLYCDPPYHNTKGYSGTTKFDATKFYAWVDEMHYFRGHTVYLSEQKAPGKRWQCLWELERTTGLDQDGPRKVVVERLFKLEV